jgi:hypothetical protein
MDADQHGIVGVFGQRAAQAVGQVVEQWRDGR